MALRELDGANARQKEIETELFNLNRTLREMRKAIPAAPFEKNWHEVAMKRMLRYAAENGYDVVAWVNGDQVTERFGLGGVVDDIYYSGTFPMSWDSDEKVRYVDINLKNGIIYHLGIDENGKPEVNFRKKVSVDDIIGLIKTDEPTNSVELKKELYK